MSLKFSIITPSFNQGKFISDTIYSVANQKYDNIEHLIIDGGSTDNTVEVIKNFPQLKWISEKDNGPANAINKGFSLANGEICAWINSDDYYETEIFSRVNKIFEDNDDIEFLCGNLCIIDEYKRILIKDHTYNYSRDYLVSVLSDVVRQPATFFRKRLLDRVGPLDEKLKYVFDYELFIRMLTVTKPCFIDENLAYYRNHSDTLTNKNIRRQSLEVLKVSRHYGALPWDKIVIRNIKKFITPWKYLVPNG